MAIKVIAQRRELKIGKNPGVKKFVMRPDLYIPIQEKKVFAEAHLLKKNFPHREVFLHDIISCIARPSS